MAAPSKGRQPCTYLVHRRILVLIQLQLNCLQGVDILRIAGRKVCLSKPS